MMREDNGRIPKAVYYQCIWLVKDMDRLRKLEAAIACGSGAEGMLYFSDEEDMPNDVRVLLQASDRLRCIRNAIDSIPEEYREDTIESIVYGTRPGDFAHENTWKKWRNRFIRELASNLKLM